jgi:translation initiation factor 2 beta subunit (eIF-2beta)/eIF-5
MKNIHLLPTEKPSRLYKSKITQNIFIGDDISQHGDATYNLNIYITSDEEIKDDWCYDEYNKVVFKNTCAGTPGASKKIILTTDQDLINDGVQAIDDEFLEWFVKNPSCEEVEVKHFGTCCGNQSITQCINCEKYNPIYKITIPQEEPKQETLEEYSNGLYKQSLKDDIDLSFYDGVRLGAKWQSERMYSEEELKNAIEISVAKALGVMSFTINEESFEQFKKK